MAEARPAARPMGPMRGPGGPGARGMRGPRPKIKNPGKLFMRVMKYVFKDYAIPYIIVIACIFIGVFKAIFQNRKYGIIKWLAVCSRWNINDGVWLCNGWKTDAVFIGRWTDASVFGPCFGSGIFLMGDVT